MAFSVMVISRQFVFECFEAYGAFGRLVHHMGEVVVSVGTAHAT